MKDKIADDIRSSIETKRKLLETEVASVEKAVGLLHAVGKDIATPAEARRILGLRARA